MPEMSLCSLRGSSSCRAKSRNPTSPTTQASPLRTSLATSLAICKYLTTYQTRGLRLRFHESLFSTYVHLLQSHRLSARWTRTGSIALSSGRWKCARSRPEGRPARLSIFSRRSLRSSTPLTFSQVSQHPASD